MSFGDFYAFTTFKDWKHFILGFPAWGFWPAQPLHKNQPNLLGHRCASKPNSPRAYCKASEMVSRSSPSESYPWDVETSKVWKSLGLKRRNFCQETQKMMLSYVVYVSTATTLEFFDIHCALMSDLVFGDSHRDQRICPCRSATLHEWEIKSLVLKSQQTGCITNQHVVVSPFTFWSVNRCPWGDAVMHKLP